MSEPALRHRLDGLEPDNLLAFLALLGLLRALETGAPEWRPRAAWDVDRPPLRPVLTLAEPAPPGAVCEVAATAVRRLLENVDFNGAGDIKLDLPEARRLLLPAADAHVSENRFFSDLCAALIANAANDQEGTKVEPTPLAYPTVATSNFLRNLVMLAKTELPEMRRRDPFYPKDAATCVAQALFTPWQRLDRPVGLRWDPEEAKRHAYQWRAPTKDLPTTQHGANRLAVVGLSALTAAPSSMAGNIYPAVLGGADRGDRFSLAWPIWRDSTSLSAIRAMLSHPRLREPDALGHLGVDHVRVTRRISLDRFRNFTRAEVLAARHQVAVGRNCN